MREIETPELPPRQFIAREIETPRLQLRPFTPDDVDDLHHLYNHRDLFKYMSNEKPLPWEQARAVIDAFTENWKRHDFGVWAVIDRNNQRLIGHCGFKFLENTPDVQIGYLLSKSYWGRGLATEAAAAVLKYGFEVAKLKRIVAIAKADNIASRRVMEKIGMKYEKDAYYYDNDVVYYALSRKAYQLEVMQLTLATKNSSLSFPIPHFL
jgi:RimJ/RimL family protein N-acetyltransferase